MEYVADSARRFQSLLGRPWCAFLDSGRIDRGGCRAGRYDILAAEPYMTLTTRGAVTDIRAAGAVRRSERDPLELLKECLGEPADVDADHGLPFRGGAIGYFAYDLGRRFERLPSIAAADIDVPDMAVGLYDWAVIVDHEQRRSWLVGEGRDRRTFADWDRLLDAVQPTDALSRAPFEVVSAVRSSFDRAGYAAAFDRVKSHIRAGDCYQVNLTQRFDAGVRGDPWYAYMKLRWLNPAPFAAYLSLPDCSVLSSSPERFLRVRDGHVETKPIKGTRRRSSDPAEDAALAEELRSSAKDRAENVMIVDLLRNDLGKHCAAGSIRATKLFDVESFANVHHLVSTVEGRLAAGRHALDLFRGAFPGGSITGAPKLRAMEIIEALEPQRRGVYCGAIGYVGFDGNMDTNIAIRTLVQHGERIYAWAGGGVVADSEVESEYQESLTKAEAMLAVLGDRAREAG
ncbi:MAG: aminodeoxychorismate synthase component I [Gammaproteobacteria bacterium]|nr:aminodeoxychorismate synthase component I [Gammaproteobacteria bacterium]